MPEVFTLQDYAATPSKLVQGVINTMRLASPLMDVIPFANAQSLQVEAIRTTSMPDISWRKIGNDHGSSKGKVEPISETAYSFGNSIDVDKVHIKNTKMLYDPKALWTKQTVEAMSRDFNDRFLNNVPITDKDAIVGLHHRTMNELPASVRLDASGLDISSDATTLSANAQDFFDLLDAAMDEVAGGKPDLILMNKQTRRRFRSLARQFGGLSTMTDAFERKFDAYNDVKIIDPGYKIDDSTNVLGNAETNDAAALSGGTYSSIYCIKLGPEYLTGFQEYPIEIIDVGMLQNGVTYRTVVDWVIGILITNPRSVTRIHSLQVV